MGKNRIHCPNCNNPFRGKRFCTRCGALNPSYSDDNSQNVEKIGLPQKPKALSQIILFFHKFFKTKP